MALEQGWVGEKVMCGKFMVSQEEHSWVFGKISVSYTDAGFLIHDMLVWKLGGRGKGDSTQFEFVHVDNSLTSSPCADLASYRSIPHHFLLPMIPLLPGSKYVTHNTLGLF